MKFLLLVAFILFCNCVFSQKISYTNRTARMDFRDGVVIVPQVGGMRHMMIVSSLRTPKLLIYNNELDLKQEIELPFEFTQKSLLTILPFNNYYYIFKEVDTSSYSLHRMYSNGKFSDETALLRSVIRSNFKDTSVDFRLFSVDDSIYLAGSLYYPKINKIITTIISLSSALQAIHVTKVVSSFESRVEAIQRLIFFPGRHLTILKKQRTDEGENLLKVSQVSMKTGTEQTAVFTSSVSFSAPDIFYNAVDSSTTILAYLGRSSNGYQVQNNIFLVTVDASFINKTNPAVIKIPVAKEMYGGFANVEAGNGLNKWMPSFGIWNTRFDRRSSSRIFVGLSSMILNANDAYFINATSYKPRLDPVDISEQFIAAPGNVRFSLFDKSFIKKYDTIAKYHRKNFIEVSQFAHFDIDNNNYLIVKEQFPSNGKSLLLFYVDDERKLASKPVPVYPKFHYSLPQMQKSGNALYFPYISKGEVGMARVAISSE